MRLASKKRHLEARGEAAFGERARGEELAGHGWGPIRYAPGSGTRRSCGNVGAFAAAYGASVSGANGGTR